MHPLRAAGGRAARGHDVSKSLGGAAGSPVLKRILSCLWSQQDKAQRETRSLAGACEVFSVHNLKRKLE